MSVVLRAAACLLVAALSSAALAAQAEPPAPGGNNPAPPVNPGAPADGAPADGSPGAPADGKAASDAPAIPISKLVFDRSELPRGFTLGKDLCCVSIEATAYFETPRVIEPYIPGPVNKSGQCFQKGGKPVGSVLVFEFAADVSKDVRDYMSDLIWGPGGRSEEHPEELLFAGRYLVIFSFPMDEPNTEWFKQQIGLRLSTPVVHDWTSLEPLMAQVVEHLLQGDGKGSLKVLRENAVKVKDYAYAQYLLGECGRSQEDWKTAIAGYSRALELHDSAADALPKDGMLWSVVNGLGTALLASGDEKKALPPLERAVTLARKGSSEQLMQSAYNYACGLARNKRFNDCFTALKEAVDLDGKCRSMALSDPDLADAVKRPEFKKLLKP